jgi:putative transposase
MNRSQMIRLNTTPEQEVYFRKACGVARHAYNWALARWKEARAEGKRVKMKDLKAAYNKIKGEQFPWCYQVTKCAPEQAFADLGASLRQLLAYERRGNATEAQTSTQGWGGSGLSTL